MPEPVRNRVALIGDVHAEDAALEQVLDFAASRVDLWVINTGTLKNDQAPGFLIVDFDAQEVLGYTLTGAIQLARRESLRTRSQPPTEP